MTSNPNPIYDVIVVGGGHAGCEAALAAARMGRRTLLLTMNLDTVALMPCNPSIGGPAKGHLVREIDALGGEMGRAIDRTYIQVRMLNTGKGPAVQALRAQADKRFYSARMKRVLERQPGLDIKQALIEGVERVPLEDGADGARVLARSAIGQTFRGRTVVLTTGTFLAGRLVCGDTTTPGGRAGEAPATVMSQSLRALGLRLGRLKTGTPPRVDARTIDFDQTELQPGSSTPLFFSFEALGEGPQAEELRRHPFPWEPNPIYPQPVPRRDAWRPQLPCYLVYTNAETHAIIRANLHRAPMFSGVIEGVGPRYCPSIEDKIVRFADKQSHGLFLEPEGWDTNEVYVQGANTSLPEDVQADLLRTIPALRRAELVRIGYAVEYDYVLTDQIGPTLEVKSVPGLFCAGQICGTSGYEEAAAQGLIAGINAARAAAGESPLVLRRDQGYVGVMIDDLVTREHREPYRLMTSRAEYRLLLRQDNADLRLTPVGYALGLIDAERYARVEAKRERIAHELGKLAGARLGPNSVQAMPDAPPIARAVSGLDYLCRPEVSPELLQALGLLDRALAPDVAEQIAIEAKYAGYIQKQQVEVERVRRLEEQPIPRDFDYDAVVGFRTEARQKLKEFRPATLGQAGRIAGVNPADVAVLLVWLERAARVRVGS